MRIYAQIDPAGNLVFSRTFTGPLWNDFWASATFGYDGDYSTRLHYSSGISGGPIAGDGMPGPYIDGEPYWLNSLYNISAEGANLGLIVYPVNPGNPLPREAWIDGPDLPPYVEVTQTWPPKPNHFTHPTGAVDHSPFDAAVHDLKSGWLSGRGHWSAVTGITSSTQTQAGNVNAFTLSVHYIGGYRRIYPRDDSLGGGARRTFPASRSVQSGNRTSGGYL